MRFVEHFNEEEMYKGKGILGKIFNYKRRLIYEYILTNLPANKNISILDIGSRDGAFLDFLIKQGYTNVKGMDINPSRKDIIKGDITNIQFKDNSFEVVTVIGVLEHLFEPILAIKEIKRIYSKMLIIDVPNEPWFSFFVGMIPPKDHVVSFSKYFLEYHLGKIYKYKLIFIKREFIGIWGKTR